MEIGKITELILYPNGLMFFQFVLDRALYIWCHYIFSHSFIEKKKKKRKCLTLIFHSFHSFIVSKFLFVRDYQIFPSIVAKYALPCVITCLLLAAPKVSVQPCPVTQLA